MPITKTTYFIVRSLRQGNYVYLSNERSFMTYVEDARKFSTGIEAINVADQQRLYGFEVVKVQISEEVTYKKPA